MKREIDVAAFVIGAVFAAAAALWLIDRTVDWNLPNAGWGLALALIAFGAVGLIKSVRKPKQDS
jgi:hypothetical protein